jgi:FixJ family two-component response regulator
MGQANDRGQIPKTIAVVDTDPAVRSSLEFSLVAEGLRVAAFTLGQDLIDAANTGPIDCLVIEQRLEDLSGIEVIERLRQRGFSAPVILLVTHPKADLRRRAGQVGVAIVEKPLMGNALTDKLHELIK